MKSNQQILRKWKQRLVRRATMLISFEYFQNLICFNVKYIKLHFTDPAWFFVDNLSSHSITRNFLRLLEQFITQYYASLTRFLSRICRQITLRKFCSIFTTHLLSSYMNRFVEILLSNYANKFCYISAKQIVDTIWWIKFCIKIIFFLTTRFVVRFYKICFRQISLSAIITRL